MRIMIKGGVWKNTEVLPLCFCILLIAMKAAKGLLTSYIAPCLRLGCINRGFLSMNGD